MFADKSEVKLIPRNISPGKPVVLCLVTNKEKFDCCKSLLQNPQDGHKSGFIVTVSLYYLSTTGDKNSFIFVGIGIQLRQF